MSSIEPATVIPNEQGRTADLGRSVEQGSVEQGTWSRDDGGGEPGSVNYESDPVLQVELEDTEYRIDVGMQGTLLSVSRRPSGSWDWSFVGEAKWDRITLRCKELPRPLREALARALKANDEGDFVGYD